MSSEGLRFVSCRLLCAALAVSSPVAIAQASTGAVGLTLESGYQFDGGDVAHPHGALVAGALGVGLSRLGTLRLATQYSYAPGSGSGEPGSDVAASSVAGLLGVQVLVDTMPDLFPTLGVDMVVRYAPATDPAAASGMVEALQLGGGFGVGLDYRIHDYVVVGGALSYTMLAPLGRLADAAELGHLISLRLRVGLYVDPAS